MPYYTRPHVKSVEYFDTKKKTNRMYNAKFCSLKTSLNGEIMLTKSVSIKKPLNQLRYLIKHEFLNNENQINKEFIIIN